MGCSLYPQGYPAIVNRLGDFKGTNLLADIGNGTMNILYINNKKAQESRCWTEKFGVNQCMIAAKNAVLDNFGVKIEESTVEQILRFGTADIQRLIWIVLLLLPDSMSQIFLPRSANMNTILA